MNAHAVVVLAAGGSRRLGRPKQLLTRDGEALVRRTVRLATATQPARLVVITGAYDAEVMAAVAGFEVESAHNPAWNSGMATSLQVAAAALAGFDGAVLVLVCDQPALEASHLRQLLAGAARSPAACAATRHGERLGVPAVVSPALLASARDLQGDTGFGARLTALDGAWVLDAPELAHDIDTPADVVAVVAEGWLDP